MDLKVYTKETVSQPSGIYNVLKPSIIDIIPEIIEQESDRSISDNTWNLDQLKNVADVTEEDGKLIINSENVRYENGNLVVTVTEEQLTGAEILDTDAEETEQRCALATIWQRGLDPIDPTDGVRWSEAILEEINVVQLMEDITNAVAEVTPTVEVVFDTVTDSEGNSYLTYTLKGAS